MAFVLSPNARVLVGHTGGGKVALRREADARGSANFTGEAVDNGEAVAIVSAPQGQFVLVSLQDGVQGFVRTRHLHVQAWPSERYPTLAEGW